MTVPPLAFMKAEKIRPRRHQEKQSMIQSLLFQSKTLNKLLNNEREKSDNFSKNRIENSPEKTKKLLTKELCFES